MSILARLEKRLRPFAIPHLTIVIIVCQVAAYAFIFVPRLRGHEEPFDQRLLLIPEKVLEGELWRIASFLIVPPFSNVVCAFFFWYLLAMMGTTLERYWGAFRYNVFLLVGYAAAVGASFLFPDAPASNGYFLSSIFLAFAFLYPEFEIYLFFLFPVKIKWLALLTWFSYAFTMLFGDWAARLLVLASISNFLLFFGSDILERMRIGRRRMAVQAKAYADRPPAFYHRCTICGITDRTHPQMDFRYCSKCAGNHCYCTEHLKTHEHLIAAGN